MSFLLKNILSKLLSKYLQISQKPNLQKGEFILSSGHLNQNNINDILRQMGIEGKIIYSEYTNLSITIPIIQILSKPMNIKIENLRVVLILGLEGKNQQQKSSQKVSTSEGPESRKEKQQKKVETSYMKSIVNRLLANMELEIKNLELIVRYQATQSSLHECEYKFQLENLIVKNSFSLLQANLLKKIICLSRVSVSINELSDNSAREKKTILFELCDLNTSLSIDYVRVNAICLLQKINIKIGLTQINSTLKLLKSFQKLSQKQKSVQDSPLSERNNVNGTQSDNKIKANNEKTEKVFVNGQLTKDNNINKDAIVDIRSPDLQSLQLKINQLSITLVNDKLDSESSQKEGSYFLFLKGLELSKEKAVKSEEEIKNKRQNNGISINDIESHQSDKQFEFTLFLQKLEMAVGSSQDKKENRQSFFMLKMCQKNQKVAMNVENWQKSNRKQFKISVKIIENKKNHSLTPQKVDFENISICLSLSKKTLKSMSIFLNQSKQIIESLKTILQQKKTYGGLSSSDSNRPSNTITKDLPSIYLTNMEATLQLRISEKGIIRKPLSLSVYLPQACKLAPTQTHNLVGNLPFVVVYWGYRDTLLTIKEIKIGMTKPNIYGSQQIILGIGSLQINAYISLLSEINQLAKMGIIIAKQLRQFFNDLNDCIGNKSISDQSISAKQGISFQNNRNKDNQIQNDEKQISKFSKVLLCVNQLTFTIGSSLYQKSEKYIPVIILQLQALKLNLNLITKIIQVKSIVKGLNLISPHNLSASSLLKSQFQVKLFWNKGKNSNSSFLNETSSASTNNCGATGQKISSCGIQIIDPLHLQVCEEDLLLLSSILQSVKSKTSIMTTIVNKTNLPIEIVYSENPLYSNGYPSFTNSVSSYTSLSEQLDKEALPGQALSQPILKTTKSEENKSNYNNKDKSDASFGSMIWNITDPLLEKYPVTPFQSIEVLLWALDIKVLIDNKYSQTITINESEASWQQGLKGNKQSLPPPPTYQMAIPFNGLGDDKYIIEVNYGTNKLTLTIKQKYQLRIFSHCSALGITSIEILTDFQLLGKWQSSISTNLSISMKEDIVGQGLMDNVTIRMRGSNTQIYKLKKLLTNNLKHDLHGLTPPECGTPFYPFYILSCKQSPLSSASNGAQIYHLLPFLVLHNNTSKTHIKLSITNKKTGEKSIFEIKQGEVCVPQLENSDWYMKQFMIKISITFDNNDTFESQDHYFNTFFMVDEGFENVIELRNLNNNGRRYVRLCEYFLFKTKVLRVEDCLSVTNHSSTFLEVKIMPSVIFRTTKNQEDKHSAKVIVGPGQTHDLPFKLKKDDRLMVGYLGAGKEPNTENSISVPVQKLFDNSNRLVLSFNFCPSQSQNGSSPFRHNLVKCELRQCPMSVASEGESQKKWASLKVELVFTDFITMTNICKKQRQIMIDEQIVKNNEKVKLSLPANIQKQYNNTFLPVNCEKIYEDLLLNQKNWINQNKDEEHLKIKLIPFQFENFELLHKNHISVSQLVHHKIIEFGNNVYALVKSFKNQNISLFFGDQLFSGGGNQSTKYFLFNNSTKHYFLMNYSQTQFAKLLFPSVAQTSSTQTSNTTVTSLKKLDKNELADEQEKTSENDQVVSPPSSLNHISNGTGEKALGRLQNHQGCSQHQNTQISKVYIESNPHNKLNFLLNKDQYDIFLCDQDYQKLEPLGIRKLEKIGIKQEKYQIENFTILDLSEINKQKREYSFVTNNITFSITLKEKSLCLLTQIKSLSLRLFEQEKFDLLIHDINIVLEKRDQNSSQKSKTFKILRVPEQSYLLLEIKCYNNLLVIKNLYMKCKIVDFHVNKQFMTFSTYLLMLLQYMSFNKQQQMYTPSSESLLDKKICLLKNEKVLLIRSLYIHPINLCLCMEINNNLDFSNMIVLPEFNMTNKYSKIKYFSKEIVNHYLSNIIAKFPKLSYVYQNLRTPISFIKSILETREIFGDQQKQSQKRAILWGKNYICLDRKYKDGLEGSAEAKNKSHRKIISLFNSVNKKVHPQFAKVTQFWLQFSLNSGQNESEGKSNPETFICQLSNILSCNICKLSQIVNVEPVYFLTNKNIRIFSMEANLPHQYVGLKQIQSIKIIRYDKKSAEVNINFRKKGGQLKIVDSLMKCYRLVALFQTLII